MGDWDAYMIIGGRRFRCFGIGRFAGTFSDYDIFTSKNIVRYIKGMRKGRDILGHYPRYFMTLYSSNILV